MQRAVTTRGRVRTDAFLEGFHAALFCQGIGFEDPVTVHACLDQVVVGWSCARQGADEAELLKLSVEVKHRRKAIGSALLKFVTTHLRGVGICQIFLEARFQNKAARSFYRRAGFTEIHRRISYYNQPTDDAVILKKILQ